MSQIETNTAAALPTPNRRRKDRLQIGGPATLYFTERSTLLVTVRNISDEGVKVAVPEGIEVLQVVRLSGQTWECLGRIVYCVREGESLVAGIQFMRPPYPKDSADYKG